VLQITDRAMNALRDLVQANGATQDQLIRAVLAETQTVTLELDAPHPNDDIIRRQQVPVLAIEPQAAERLRNCTLDFGRREEDGQLGFQVLSPPA